MELKAILGLLAVALAVAAYIPIYYGIFFGTIRPHIYTYFVWTVTVLVAFLASLTSGGGAGSWSLGITTILVMGIFLLCFKHGTKDVTKSDRIILALAVISIIPWILTKDPVISVILVTFIEALSFIPSMRKTWNDPYSESYLPWIINVFKHTLIVAAVTNYSISTALYSSFLVSMNILFAAEIIMRRRMLKKRAL